jgi:hypothetical protein
MAAVRIAWVLPLSASAGGPVKSGLFWGLVDEGVEVGVEAFAAG